jgi:hypothetical protein
MRAYTHRVLSIEHVVGREHIDDGALLKFDSITVKGSQAPLASSTVSELLGAVNPLP